ncbi:MULTISPECIES: serine hydrolase [unclassified Caballeronia]|uniref:serine hydrolase domain-containing protein n=1 Tax=unclassified Caballeronia TaxID=2646786 RepID=UPI0028641C6B|nr:MULTISPECIES: serine hydrolase [unclassified Caballeronia]MDR5773561.1 serine hydrolase [Caballeronia sp. LZ002]MDR5848995.1 serine hydrolase [Caballeronia sp. LZ003]
MNETLKRAIQFSIDHESKWDRNVDGNWGVHINDPAPWNKLLGPVHDRGPVSGAIALDGHVITTWGEPDRADLTFSIAKTYLALLAGVAHDRGLLPDVDEPVRERVPGIGFDDAHNAPVTWAQLLLQTSEWQGECFGLSDQADHYRAVTFGEPPAGKKGDLRPLQMPGTFWEYNDVRINQLSLALMHLFRRPLPEVFREAIAEPCGMSDGWQWVGYDHAWTEIDGRRMQSVPGGTHWGGGMSVSANDQLKIARMLLDEGLVSGRRVLSREWIEKMRTPCDIAPFYGFLVWLNTGRKMFPSVPESSYFGVGAGSSFMWIEPSTRLAVIVRWLDSAFAGEFFGLVFDGVKGMTR